MSNAPEPPLTERERALAQALEAEQQRRQRVQLALAAAVLLLLAGSCALTWWQKRAKQDHETARAQADAERMAIEAQIDAERRFMSERGQHGAAADLALANDLRKQHKFTAAATTLAKAAERANDKPELLSQIKQAQRDLALVARLDDVRYRKWLWVTQANGKEEFNTRIAPAEYREAFAEHGLKLTELDAAEAAKRIAASAVKAELVAALDDWALHEPEVALRNKLLQVARRADPGPLTDRLRDPAVRADPKAVAKLAQDVDPSAAPAVVPVLAQLMERHGLDPSPLLTAALHKHPSDFELSFLLGQFRQSRGDRRAISAYQAACAIRPDDATVWNNLGGALRHAGNLDGAVAVFRRAIELDPKLPLAYSNLGNALCERGDAEVMEAFRRAAELAAALERPVAPPPRAIDR